ncbi:MAG: beta-lactamase family protein [Acidobacteria bacterium]|nr:beta-lactamase family protein [Acidobacteriota bacterium]
MNRGSLGHWGIVGSLAFAAAQIMAPPSLAQGTVTAGDTAVPSTEAGRCATAYLAAFNAGEDAMRRFFLDWASAESLAERPVDVRLGIYGRLRQDLGQLAARRVVSSSDGSLTVLAEGRDDLWVELTLVMTGDAPRRLAGIRVEQAEPGGDTPSQGTPLAIGELAGQAERLVAEAVGKDEFSGAVLLARDGAVLLEKAWGQANKSHGVANRVDTKFCLGSINKLFTRIVVLQLEAQGRLLLDDPLGKHLPDYPNRDAATRVTIRHLLDMTSGIGDFFNEKFDAMPKDRLRTTADYLRLFASDPLLFAPGSQRRYSNGGYVVLGAVIEKVTGRSYYDVVRAQVFAPAGMTDTDSYEVDVPVPNLATGYTREGGRDEGWRSNVYTKPARGSSAGGGYSTLRDLLRFTAALTEGTLLSRPYTAWVLGGPEPGAGTADARSGGGQGLGVAGGAPGMNAVLDVDLDAGFTLVVLSNYDPPAAERVARQIRALLRRVRSGPSAD